MVWQTLRYLKPGKIESLFLSPSYHFAYYGFDWIKPWPGDGLYWHFYIMVVLATFIVVGFAYRMSMCLYFLAYTYVFLLEPAYYNNHYYLVALLSFLMIFLPANQALSIDSKLKPSIRRTTTPAWMLWFLRFQIGVVYFYGGLAKLNLDWLHGWPMKHWLTEFDTHSPLGSLLSQAWMGHFMSISGLLLDLLAVPLLLWKRTRLTTACLLLTFHLVNSRLFFIGVFPWLMLGALLLFFPPSWPKSLLLKLKLRTELPATVTTPSLQKHTLNKVILSGVVLFIALQLLIPLRHHLYPGNVSWTEEGYMFSWRMKLRSKRGRITFFAKNPSDEQPVKVPFKHLLTRKQQAAMKSQPEMARQFSHYLAEQLRIEGGYEKVEIYAESTSSLNGREYETFIDPNVDLAAEPFTFTPKKWIVPLKPTTDYTKRYNT